MLKVVPWGFRRILKWVSDTYNTTIIVTENGYSDYGELEDVDRIVYTQVMRQLQGFCKVGCLILCNYSCI